MNINILWTVFKARFVLILFTLVLTVSVTVVLTKLQPNRFDANTSLILNFDGSTPFEQSTMPAQFVSSYIATQLDIISSQSVALKVVDKLKPVEDQIIKLMTLDVDKSPWQPGDTVTVVDDLKPAESQILQLNTPGDDNTSGSTRHLLANKLIEGLNVQPSRDSRVVNINFSFKDPVLAARIANAFVDAYIETNLELSIEPAARSAHWFDDQTKVFRQRREEAQKRLTDYQQDKGIIMIDERLDTEANRLNELSKNYLEAQATVYDVKSRQLGENHPEYIGAIKREQSLHDSLEEQKLKFLQIKQQRDQLDVLAREVETERQAYEEMQKRYYVTKLESQFNQTNIAILNRAITPTKPSSPNLLLNVISAIVLGSVISFVLAFLAELFDRRIRTEDDLDGLLGTKVLAQI
ncbi:hypothetical protein FT643_17620 [Ketobacter sp. MCCC 1A13808]|uniref:GNVR domain-containing protein n=1 Tax=Ketobacter sp. MCCC 1A13808 TaxID=2602738 RepID=UPI000F0EEEB0|nr:GNVR domain-containing protein [Ketobacter sp. MCCC 1A13808]MVF13962.1 hypothetical protein [Ketobacter sp. MCCC 1A13808]RLP53436.1 MAG: hypothetical protein D6160_15885 [Ketobacter sp.]